LKRGWIAAIVIVTILGFIGAVLGMWARMLVPDAPPGLAFGQMLAEHTPVWLGALAISGVIAATMSTVDMMYQIVANTLTRDLFQRFLAINDRDRVLRLSRYSMLAAGAITIGLAVAWPDGLPELISFAFAMGGPLTILSLDAWTIRYGTKEGTVAMVAAAVLAVIYWVVASPAIAAQIDVIWVSVVVSPVAYYGVSSVVKVTGSWWTEPNSLTEVEEVKPTGDD
jgi:Na+/proline symporter